MTTAPTPQRVDDIREKEGWVLLELDFEPEMNCEVKSDGHECTLIATSIRITKCGQLPVKTVCDAYVSLCIKFMEREGAFCTGCRKHPSTCWSFTPIGGH